MDNCCDSLLKYLVFILNFFLFSTGVALISIGAYIQTQMSDYLNFLGESYLNSSILFIVLGVVVLIIGFFGCCGACTENACMTTTFAVLLGLVVIVQIGAAVAVFVFKGQADAAISDKMRDGMKNYGTDPKYAGVTDTWNVVQSDFDCCGVDNYTDWKETPFARLGGDLPDSCCVEYKTDCGKNFFDNPDTKKINTVGCFQRLKDTVEDNVEVVGGVAIGIVVIQIVLVLISCMLANNMRRRNNYV